MSRFGREACWVLIREQLHQPVVLLDHGVDEEVQQIAVERTLVSTHDVLPTHGVGEGEVVHLGLKGVLPLAQAGNMVAEGSLLSVQGFNIKGHETNNTEDDLIVVEDSELSYFEHGCSEQTIDQGSVDNASSAELKFSASLGAGLMARSVRKEEPVVNTGSAKFVQVKEPGFNQSTEALTFRQLQSAGICIFLTVPCYLDMFDPLNRVIFIPLNRVSVAHSQMLQLHSQDLWSQHHMLKHRVQASLSFVLKHIITYNYYESEPDTMMTVIKLGGYVYRGYSAFSVTKIIFDEMSIVKGWKEVHDAV